ncbi:MAG TPA: AMP-binding protein [Thermoanaerobaculia bacterium]|nr:AMP-binding protein [Thermoanaerobaculia bacterium]
MNPRDLSLYDVLDRNARIFSDRLALVDERGAEHTFAELRAAVDSLATGLTGLGLVPGDRVAVLALNSRRFIELYLACARQGLIAYPINWRLSTEEIGRIIERARPRAFVVDGASAEKLPAGSVADTIERWIEIDSDEEPHAEGFLPWGSITVTGEPIPPVAVASDDPFCVLATAAVDVVPRGAVLSHGNVIASNIQEIASLGLTPEHRSLCALPLFHVAGLGHALAHLHAGGANVVLPRFEAAASVELIDRWSITHIADFPPVLAQTLDAAEAAGSELESLLHVTGLDSPQTMERLHETTGATFWTGFGQAETTGMVTMQNARERLGCAGRTAELAIVDLVDDYGRAVEVGEPGEIVVRGPLVFLGYDRDVEASAYAARGGWHHTGDVGRFDEEGRLYYVKRKAEKELIKPGGENVYPAEVETVIAELPGITHACVFGVPDATWGEAIRAVVEVEGDAGATVTPEAVIEHVGSRIARYKRPRHVEVVDRLPRSEDGSIDREAVRARWGVKVV